MTKSSETYSMNLIVQWPRLICQRWRQFWFLGSWPLFLSWWLFRRGCICINISLCRSVCDTGMGWWLILWKNDRQKMWSHDTESCKSLAGTQAHTHCLQEQSLLISYHMRQRLSLHAGSYGSFLAKQTGNRSVWIILILAQGRRPSPVVCVCSVSPL